MDNFRLAVKGFIVKNNELLIVQRVSKSSHQPNMWELPGGRLTLGESPFDGLKREISEETGLQVDIHEPLSVRHFIRQDGQTITLIVFVCEVVDGDLKISDEHQQMKFIPLDQYKDVIDPWYYGECDRYISTHH